MALLAEVWTALTGEADGAQRTPTQEGKHLAGESCEPAPPAAVRLTGELDLLPSVFPVLEVAVAAAGSALLAAAGLESLRTGEAAPDVELDTRQLACALRSEHLVRRNGQPAGRGFGPLSQFFRARDGWIRLHANYPWHQQRLLEVLGTAAEPDAVASAVAGWSAVPLEDAIFGAGGCAAAVRRPEEWRAQPQGAAIDQLPLLELLPAAESARGLRLGGPFVLSGVRVLDFTRVIAGPVCTRLLGALGADVLRIDTPNLPENESNALDSLAGKRSAFLDLERPEDRRRLGELLDGADVVVQGYRPGALARFGLSADELVARWPGLTLLSLSAWSHAGPWAGRRGFDSLVQAACGIDQCEAAGADKPGVLPCQLLDHTTGYLAAAAVLTALSRRYTDGSTWHARVSLAQTAAWVLRQPVRPKTQDVSLDPSPYLAELDSPAGRVALVTPPGRLGSRPLSWPTPLARYGADRPEWLASVPA